MTWLEYFRMVFEWIWLEISALPHNDFLRRVRARAAGFWRRTQRLALITIIIPIIVFIAGIFFHSRPTIAIAGLLATLCWGAILLSFAGIAELIAELIAAISKKAPNSGSETRAKIYIHAVATILLGEMLVVGYAIIVPVWNNPGAIPIVAMIAIILATMMSVWEMRFKVFRQIAFWIAVVAFVFFTASFFLPNTFSVIEREAPRVDQYFSGIVDDGDAPDYQSQRKALLKNWRESEEKAIIEMLNQNLIHPEEADRRMGLLISQYDKELEELQRNFAKNNPEQEIKWHDFKKSIPSFPVALKIVFIAAAAFLILGLIWKYLSNRWLRTAALLAIGGTAIYFIIAILQSNGVAI